MISNRSRTSISSLVASLLLGGLLALCGNTNEPKIDDESKSARGADGSDVSAIGAIHSVMKNQSEAWNRGDIEAFMVGYWNDPQLTFSSGGTTQRGWIATRDRYKAKYSSRETMGTLTFSDLETKLLGDDVALTLGRWHLKRDEPAEGNFSLIWRKIDNQWLVIHDHSSLQAK